MVKEKKIPEGYKETEVGIIPKEWAINSIEELIKQDIIEKPLDGNHGNLHPKSGDYVNTGIPFVMANNVINGKVDLLNCNFIRESQASKLRKGFSIAGDVLLTHKGTIGNTAIVPKIKTDYIMLTPQVTYYRVKNQEKIYNKFIRSYFDSAKFKQKLNEMSGGGTRAYIGIVKQQKLPFVLPGIEEQKVIATALSDIDDLTSSLEKLINKKKLIKQGAMQELLTGKKRLDGFSEEWGEIYLEDISDFYNGKAHENSLVAIGSYIVVNSKYISSSGKIKKYSNEAYCIAEKDDILMVMSDVPNGKAISKCYLVEDNNKYTVNQRVCVIRIKHGTSKYYYYRLNRNKYYLSFDDGVKQTNLRKSDILGIKMKVPREEEQTAIANILSEMDREIEKLELKLHKYKNIKRGMMEELLTGKRRLI